MYALILFAGLSLSTTAQRPQAALQIVGRAYVISGEVRLQRPGSVARCASSVERLAVGDEVVAARNSEAIIWMQRSGQRFKIVGAARVRALGNAIKVLAGRAPVKLPAISASSSKLITGHPLRPQGGMIVRGSGLQISPLGCLRDEPREVSWKGAKNSAQLSLAVADGGAPVFEKTVKTSSIEIPHGLLKRGVTYHVTVVANLESTARASTQTFRILTDAERQDLVQAEREIDSLRHSSSRSDPSIDLLAAELYDRFALYQDSLNALYRAAAFLEPSPNLSRLIEEKRQLCSGI